MRENSDNATQLQSSTFPTFHRNNTFGTETRDSTAPPFSKQYIGFDGHGHRLCQMLCDFFCLHQHPQSISIVVYIVPPEDGETETARDAAMMLVSLHQAARVETGCSVAIRHLQIGIPLRLNPDPQVRKDGVRCPHRDDPFQHFTRAEDSVSSGQFHLYCGHRSW